MLTDLTGYFTSPLTLVRFTPIIASTTILEKKSDSLKGEEEDNLCFKGSAIMWLLASFKGSHTNGMMYPHLSLSEWCMVYNHWSFQQ